MDEKSKPIRTKTVGVYSLTSAVRTHHGKPDVSYYITYKDASGKKFWEKIGWRSEGITQATAAIKRQARMEALRVGTPIDKSSRTLTFGAAYAEWAATHLPTLKDNGTTKLLAAKYILPRFQGRAMNSITPLDLDKLRLDMDKCGLSAQTIKHVLGIVRRVYRKAAVWRIYSGPIPTDAISMPKPDAERMRYLTKQEAAALLCTLQKLSPLWHDIALLSMYTGMRLDDILKLRGRQINITSGIIDVIEAKPGTYTAYLPEPAKVMLQTRITAPDDLIFPSPRGGEKIHKAGKPFRRAVKLCGFNDTVSDPRYKVVFHTLRHTFASWLAQQGESINVIAQLMGHATLKMTQRYAKLSPDTKHTAVNKLNLDTALL
jgi:integrase